MNNNIYSLLRELASTVKAQNLFFASKEINNLRLFKNSTDLSKIQEVYLSFLFSYNNLSTAVAVENVSEYVLHSEIIAEAYMLYKRKKPRTEDKPRRKGLNLVAGSKIIFPKKNKEVK